MSARSDLFGMTDAERCRERIREERGDYEPSARKGGIASTDTPREAAAELARLVEHALGWVDDGTRDGSYRHPHVEVDVADAIDMAVAARRLLALAKGEAGQ